MIKNIRLTNVRGVTDSFELDKINIITGGNAVGKSTIIQSIKEIYKGKTTIKEGEVVIEDTEGLILQSINGILPKNLLLGNEMELMTPGFFMSGQLISGLNKSKEDKRKTISDLLGIDRDGFFKSEGVDYNIKGLTAELKESNIIETTYSGQIIELQKELKNLKEVSKPKEGIHLQDTEDKEVEGNEYLLEQLKKELTIKKSKLQNELVIKEEPKEVILIEEKIIEKGNGDELLKLKQELESITLEGKNIPTVCDKCNQTIQDANKQKELIRTRYIDIAGKINNFVIKDAVIQKGNIELYQQYINDKDNYIAYQRKCDEIINSNKIINESIKELENKISSFDLVKTRIIKGSKGNTSEYNNYLQELELYNQYVTTKKIKEQDITDLSSKIKNTNSKELEDKIKKYKDVENKFVKFVENKLVIGDMRIIFYRQLQSPNAAGEMFASEFNIEYKGKLYDECSGGERGIIDILLAKLFIDAYGLIDFILIDNAEISNKNLKDVIKNHLSNLQVISTRIGTGSLKLKLTL